MTAPVYESIEQRAAREGRSTASVRRDIAAGKLTVVKFGRLVRILVQPERVADVGDVLTAGRAGRKVQVRG